MRSAGSSRIGAGCQASCNRCERPSTGRQTVSFQPAGSLKRLKRDRLTKKLGKGDRDGQAAVRAGACGDRAVVRLRDRAHDGQAEAGTAAVSGAIRSAAPKWLEEPADGLGWHR